MTIQVVDPHHFVRRARQIRAQIPDLLSQWGLVPKFKRWRLAQDPDTGMVILFGVLNNKYIATQTTTPFSNYFDPRLLHDLETALHVQVITSSNDGLRYAFILDRGSIDMLPDQLEPFFNDDKLIVRVVYRERPAKKQPDSPITLAQLNGAETVDDQASDESTEESRLKVFEEIKTREDAAR